jgi:hypothetical protein
MTNHGHNPKEIDMTTQTTTDRIRTENYTDQQATDEAVLLLVRKLRRLHPDTYVAVMTKLPEGARNALHFADLRADTLRAYDQRDGITREYVDPYAELDDDDERTES